MTDGSFAGGATISDAWSYRGFEAIVLENERLRAVVLAGHGAKVTELVSKRAGRDLLFHHPRLDVRAPVFGVNADDWWTGGIDEIAPTGHPCVVGGEQLPFLGEFWSQAWAATIVERGPDRVVVDLVAHGVITPLRLERRMELAAGEPVLRSRHVVRNVGHEPVDFMWGLHPGLAIRPGSRIQVPAASGVFAEGHPTLHVEPGTRFAWPMLPVRDGDAIDLSTARPPTPPSWELVYLDALSAGWLAVTDPPTRSGFAITFDPKVLPVVWLWGVYGGWRGIYAAAVEAWTSYPARLDQAIEAGRQVTLAPGETWEATVGLVAFEGVTSVSGVHADGRVEGDG